MTAKEKIKEKWEEELKDILSNEAVKQEYEKLNIFESLYQAKDCSLFAYFDEFGYSGGTLKEGDVFVNYINETKLDAEFPSRNEAKNELFKQLEIKLND